MVWAAVFVTIVIVRLCCREGLQRYMHVMVHRDESAGEGVISEWQGRVAEIDRKFR